LNPCARSPVTVTLHIHIHLLIQSSQSSQVSRGRQRWPRVAKGAWHVCPWREAVKRGKRDRCRAFLVDPQGERGLLAGKEWLRADLSQPPPPPNLSSATYEIRCYHKKGLVAPKHLQRDKVRGNGIGGRPLERWRRRGRLGGELPFEKFWFSLNPEW